MDSTRSPVIEFLTRPDCSVCDDGWTTVSAWSRILRVDVVQRDITGDPSAATYAERVPVLLVGGRPVLEGRWTSMDAVRELWRARRSASRHSEQ